MTYMLAIAATSVALLLLSVPVAFALGLSCLLVMVLWPGTPFLLVAQKTLNGMDSLPLLAIPFFLLASGIMNAGGLTDRVVNVFNGIVGRLRGGLAMVNVAVNIFFAGISGSAVADATATGSILIPAMKRNGYPGPFAAGLTAAAAACGPVIPPSIVLIVYGVVAHVSIFRLFLAGYLPGLLLAALLVSYVWYAATERGYAKQPRVGLREIISRIRLGFWALTMPVGLVLGILLGVFTVVELGAVLVVYAILVGLIYRQLSLREIPQILLQVGLDAANIMFIVITHLRCGCAVDAGYRRACTQRVSLGRPWCPAPAGTRGSPFQMPARLADGLGPESDRAGGSPPTFAPSRFPGIWIPRADLQEGKAA